MSMNYWHRQDRTPLYPELEWSKPENRMHAGKLLIVGGNLHGFSAPANAFNAADKAGIGMTRVVLPDAIQKSVKAFIPEADFAPSTPSGSFSTKSLETFLEHAGWADAVLLAGDLGRNSETAVVLEAFVGKHNGLVTLAKDVVDYFTDTPNTLLDREDTLLVLSFAQLQKLATNAKFKTALTYDMDLLRLVTALHEFTLEHPAYIITKHHEVMIVACGGEVSTTKLINDREIWRVNTAAHAAVWWLQHPQKPFEAITTAVLTSE